MQKYHHNMMRNPFKDIFILVFLGFISLHAYAQQTICYKNGPAVLPGGWQISAPGLGIEDGTIVARGTPMINIVVPSGQRTDLQVDQVYRSMSGGNINNAIPLPQTPGVGVRIKWGAYTSSSPITVQQIPSETILFTQPVQTTLNSSYGNGYGAYYINLYYIYEVVVIDKRLYKGGKLIPITKSAFSSIRGPYTGECIDGNIDMLGIIGTDFNAPDLPRPYVSTCTSAALTQTVKMPPIHRSQVAADGSAKENGGVGETRINLRGINCSPNTVINAYFTDNNDAYATKFYLKSSNATTGIRMYYLENNSAVKFGPAPKGSSMPQHAPILSTMIPNSTSDVLMQFSAQYVRLPGVAAENVQGGALKASATVTFVYD